jgi:hypothetical protein
MSLDLEILSPNDRPALLGVSTPDILAYAQGVLDQMGYKVHSASTHDEFIERFGRVQYEFVFLEERFDGATPDEHKSLNTLQGMPMALRRHTTALLLGGELETLNALQAFQRSVHAVINHVDLDKLMLVIQQVVNDNLTFLNVYRDVQSRIAQGKR